MYDGIVWWQVCLWKRNQCGPSFPSCHDFKVLQCIVGRVGSSGVYVWSKAVAHGDWLCGQLNQTLTKTAETVLLWKNNKRRKTNPIKNSNTQLWGKKIHFEQLYAVNCLTPFHPIGFQL